MSPLESLSPGAHAWRWRPRPGIVLPWLAVLATAAAWSALARSEHGMATAGIWPVFLAWNAMMVAMMLPSTLPWFTLLVSLEAGHPYGAVLRFAVGYFAVWTAYSAVAAWTQLALHRSLVLGGDLALAPPLAGGLLMAVGLYQLTPLKRACLRHCRSPFGYLLTHWSGEPGWALRAGFAHGVRCVGCCWALMALAFVTGVMSLWGMAAVTLAICVEKLAPQGEKWSRGFGVGLIALGAFVLARG